MSPFSQVAILAAQDSQRKWGPPACVTLAQYMVESACGKFEPPGSNNPFGIKAVEGQPSVMAMTTEYVDGKPVREEQAFAKYSSLADAFDAHARLLATVRVYKEAMAHCDDWNMFLEFMAPHYATSPTYRAAISAVVGKYGLNKFNVPTVADPRSPDVVLAPKSAAEAPGFAVGSVHWTQQRLLLWGYKLPKFGADGAWGEETMTAVKTFQEKEGLQDKDGMMTVETETALAKDPPEPTPAEPTPAKAA